MANTLKSWMILNNATADIPAAGITGAHDFDTTLLTPSYDNGSNKVPWRANISIALFAGVYPATARTFSPAASPTYTAWGGATNQWSKRILDFTRFRQARIYVRGDLQAGSTSITMRARDLTNGQTIASVLINTTGINDWLGSWSNLNSNTYTNGDAYYELQGLEGAGGDAIIVGDIVLELR